MTKNLQVDQEVMIDRTTDPYLDSKTGKILGTSYQDQIVTFYIVGLDEPHPVTGVKAIQLIEGCVFPI